MNQKNSYINTEALGAMEKAVPGVASKCLLLIAAARCAHAKKTTDNCKY